MNNQEKAWMLCGLRVEAYKSYHDRLNLGRRGIFKAKDFCQAEHRENRVAWAADPEIKVLVQDQLDEALGRAQGGLSLVVGCLKGLMANDRPNSGDYPMDEIQEYLKRALKLMEEKLC